MHLDTGSSDLWVNTQSSSFCSSRSSQCQTYGTYNANKSSTYRYLNSNFNISYVDGTSAVGDYASDTIRFQNVDISAFQFGIGYNSSSNQGVLGIGYESDEAQVARFSQQSYQNLPAKLRADGTIASNAYSIWLNSLVASAGNLLFGGIDTDHFKGNLVTVPVQSVDDTYGEFFITLTGVNYGSITVQSNMALAVLLDTGTSLTYLPNELAHKIFNVINATFQQEQGVAYVPCSLRDENNIIDFRFSAPAAIKVPLSELVLDPHNLTGRSLSFDNGLPACLFGISSSPDHSTSVLGDTFLRSAYIVYDLDNNAISLAQARYNVMTSNVREISKGFNGVPSAIVAQNPVEAASGLPSNTGIKNSSTDDDSGTISAVPMQNTLLAFCTAAALSLLSIV